MMCLRSLRPVSLITLADRLISILLILPDRFVDMSSPSPVQIREANAHLAALHRRVADLEQKLEAAENTLREQAESLIRKDEQLRAATQEITENKDR